MMTPENEPMDAHELVGGPEFTVARVFDFADPDTGPGFEPGRPAVDDPAEREQLLEYLRGGYPILTTMAMMNDMLDPGAGSVVPASFRTDGLWIWTDTVEYYLDRHGIEPDPELTQHIREQVSAGVLVPDTDEETAIRACDFILNPPPEEASEPVWYPGRRSE